MVVGISVAVVAGLVALLVWFFAAREERIRLHELSLAEVGREYGMLPLVRTPLGTSHFNRYMFTRDGDPAFVVPFSEYVRVGLDGLKGALSLINDRQFVTISPVAWTLDLEYRLHEEQEGPWSGIVPPGTLTDYSSIPAPLQWLVGRPTGLLARAAIVHDYGYRYDKAERTPERRRAWDETLLRLMRQDGVRPTRRVLIYAGVRAGGRRPYAKSTAMLEDSEFQNLLEVVEERTREMIRALADLFDDDLNPVPARERVGHLERPGSRQMIESMNRARYGTPHPTERQLQAEEAKHAPGVLKRVWAQTGDQIIRAVRGY